MSPSLLIGQHPGTAARPAAAQTEPGSMRGGGAANQASVLSWGPLLGLGVVLVLVGGLLRRRDRRADKPLLDSGANVTPLQKPRQPPGPAARTG